MIRAVVVLGLISLAACGRLGFDVIVDHSARSTLRVDRAALTEALIDFPLLLVLDDTRARRDWMAQDASDLRFRDQNGTLLAHEIEQVGVPGGAPLVAWVRTPRIEGTSTTLTVEYGGSPGPLAAIPMWNASYLGVWHMQGTGTLVDATTNHLDGVVSGTTTATGIVGSARSFDENGPDSVVVARGAGLGFPQATLTAWINPRTQPKGYYAAITREYDLTPEDDFYLGTQDLDVNAGVATVSTGAPFIVGPPIQVGRWTHIAFAYDGATSRMFIDGVEVDGQPASGVPVASDGPIYIGCGRNDDVGTTPLGVPDVDFMNGLLDEIRLEQVGRSPAWIAAEVASQRDQMISYGPIESP